MSWVIRNTGLAVRRQTCSSSSCICSRVNASRAPKGSSISSTRGSAARARARPTRCFWPPDSCQMRRLSKPARSTSASISRARTSRCALLTPVSSRPKPTLASTSCQGSRASSWNTTPRSALGPLTGTPSRLMRPAEGSTKPAIRFNNDVLPLTDGPRATSNCWGPSSSEMSDSTGSVAPGYCALMRSSCSKAIAMNSWSVGNELGAYVRGVVRQHCFDLALLLEERGGIGHRLGGRRAQQGHLLSGQRVDVALQQRGDVAGLGTGELHQLVDVGFVGEPGLWVFAVCGVGIQSDFGESADDFRVLLGEVLTHDPRVEGRRAERGQFAGSDQHPG